jgi:hypothetical protein
MENFVEIPQNMMTIQAGTRPRHPQAIRIESRVIRIIIAYNCTIDRFLLLEDLVLFVDSFLLKLWPWTLTRLRRSTHPR